MFSEDMFNYMDIEKELENYHNNPGTAVIFQRMTQIGFTRHKFAITLEYIQSIDDEMKFDDIIEMLRAASVKWNEVVAMLLKSYFMKKREKIYSRILVKLSKIKVLEEEIAMLKKLVYS